MTETQATMGQWASETFPGGDNLSPRHCLRLLEEVAELCKAAGARSGQVVTASLKAFSDAELALADMGFGFPDPGKIPEEMADCEIVLRVLAHRRGIDLDAEVDRKMAINRARRWKVGPDGTGYHVKAEAPE